MKETDFLHVGTNQGKLKVDLMTFWLSMVKNDHGSLVHETLKSTVY